MRDTYIFVSRALLDLSHDARLRDTYISVSRALRVKMKKTLKKEATNAITASFSHFLRFTFIFHISRASLDFSHDARYIYFFFTRIACENEKDFEKKKKTTRQTRRSSFYFLFYNKDFSFLFICIVWGLV